MRIYYKTLRLSACLFALLCLSSVSYASQPSDDVHLCLPLNLEDTQKRDSIYAATKHALNLNVGEPRTVRMIYFLPNDRPFRQEVVDSMKVTIRQIQTFYAEQMHGYGDKTFRFETDAQGNPLVHRLDGQHPDSYYLDDTVGTVFNEIEQVFNLDANIYFTVIDNGTNSIGSIGQSARGAGSRMGKNGGIALFPGEFIWHVVAHELGHAFGLQHDFRDNAYIMSYGAGRNRLSMCHAEFLAVHPYFNPDASIEEAQLPNIELISSRGYSAGSKSVSVQLKVSDLEGLHQVLLFVRTRKPHIAAGFREVKTCRGLAGEKDTVIEFEYDGVIPSVTGPSLSNPTIHPIYIEAVDTDGNVGSVYFELWETPPNYITTLEGHTRAVRSVVFSPDGTILASGSQDSTIKLWDVATKTNIATLSGHNNEVNTVSFSPDGTILASGSQDRTIRLWDVATRTEIATIEDRDRGAIISVSFSPNGTMLASGASGGTVKLWDVATGTSIATLEGHEDWVSAVSFSPDGTMLASGSGDRTIRLWDVATRTEIATIEGKDRILSVSFSPDGTILASGAFDYTVKLWDVSTKENITTLEGHTFFVNSVVFYSDGTILASGSEDKTVKLWDVATGTNITTFSGYEGGVESVAFSPDGTILASSSWDHTVRLWDISEWQLPRPAMLVKISGDNQRGTPDSELANPLIVEVRDQYGAVFEGATVTFTVTEGDGKLSGRFTVEKAITDANGRAQSTLMLGDNPGTNTVEVSVAGVKVSFNAVGIGTSSTSITDGSYQTWSLPDGAIFRLGKGRIRGSDRAVVYSPDGRSLAVASSIGIYLYDVATLREFALFTGHTSWVESVAFSPDGKMLASGSADRTVKLWDIATRTNIATFEGHTDRLESVAFSPDGTMLASGARDNTVKLWDVVTGENIATLEEHTSYVNSVSFSPDGKILASGSEDDTIKLWDVETRENIATFETHKYRVWSVAFSPDGTTLAAGLWDEVQLWDVATGTNIATFETHRAESVAFSPDGRSLAAASSTGIYLYDVTTFRELALFTGDTYWVQSVAFSPDGSTLASTLQNNTVKLWDVATHNITILRHTSEVESVAFSPDGTTLIWGAKNYRVNLWDVVTGENITMLKGDVGFDSISPDGTTLASGTGHEIWLWDLETGENIAMLKGHRSPVLDVLFSPDGETIASGSWNGLVKLWDVAMEENIATLGGHTAGVNSIAYSPDGTTLASGSTNGSVLLWDVATGENIATFEGHTAGVNSVAYSPDGTTLASGSTNGTILLWDVAEEKNIATLEARNLVYSVVFSPDGAILASGSANGTILLWNVSTVQSVVTFEGHTDLISSIAFSPKGTKLASGSEDGTALLWDVSQYVTPVVYMPDANLRAVIRDALDKSRFAPITVTDMASLTTLDASNRNIRDLTGLKSATNLTELNLKDNPLSSLSLNTHIPALQERGVEVLFDRHTTLVKISESEQVGVPGAVLETPLVVEVRDQDGNVLAGAPVAFVVTAGDGALSVETTVTDSSGRASSVLTLGNSLEPIVVSVMVIGIEQPVTFLIESMATPDFDGDGTVDFADFLLFVEQFGFSEDDAGYETRFDLDGDGMIGFGDFLIFANAFGKVVSSN